MLGIVMDRPEALAAYLQTGAEIVCIDLSVFGRSEVFSTMLMLAQAALRTRSRDLLKSVHSFLTYFHLENSEYGGGAALAAWLGDGQGLAAALLHAVADTAPIDTIDLLADIMWALVDTSLGVAPLHAAVFSPTFPVPVVPEGHRAAFIQGISNHNARSTAPVAFTNAVIEFAKVCRLPWLRDG